MRSRDKILGAAIDRIERSGFEAASIAGVSKEAGVSRQTVYSIFGSREELVSQAVASLAVSTMGRVVDALDPHGDATEYIIEMITTGRGAVREHRILATLLRSDRDNPLFDDGVVDRTKPVVAQIIAPLAECNADVAADLDDILEIVSRLTLSLIFFGSDTVRTDDQLRRFLHKLLSPLIP